MLLFWGHNLSNIEHIVVKFTSLVSLQQVNHPTEGILIVSSHICHCHVALLIVHLLLLLPFSDAQLLFLWLWNVKVHHETALHRRWLCDNRKWLLRFWDQVIGMANHPSCLLIVCFVWLQLLYCLYMCVFFFLLLFFVKPKVWQLPWAVMSLLWLLCPDSHTMAVIM